MKIGVGIILTIFKLSSCLVECIPGKQFNNLPPDINDRIAQRLSHSDHINMLKTVLNVDSAPAVFIEKFGIHSIDKLMQYKSEKKYAWFCAAVVKRMPRNYLSHIINLAAYKGNWETVKFMLSIGTDAKLLHYSIRRAFVHGILDDLEILNRIVDQRVLDIQAVNAEQLDLDALNELLLKQDQNDIALLRERLKITLPIVSGSLNIKAIDDLLMFAVEYRFDDDIIKILVVFGADVHQRKGSCLQWAATYFRSQVVLMLLGAGAEIEDDNSSSLLDAIEIFNGMRSDANLGFQVIKIFLDYGADINFNAGEPLIKAVSCCELGCKPVIELLLEHGADVHQRYNDALFIAKEECEADIVKLLQDKGATFDSNDSAALKLQLERYQIILMLIHAKVPIEWDSLPGFEEGLKIFVSEIRESLQSDDPVDRRETLRESLEITNFVLQIQQREDSSSLDPDPGKVVCLALRIGDDEFKRRCLKNLVCTESNSGDRHTREYIHQWAEENNFGELLEALTRSKASLPSGLTGIPEDFNGR